MDMATPQVRRNRELKHMKKHQHEKLMNKIDKYIESKKKKQYIKPYDIEYGIYIFYVEPTTKLLNKVSEHYLTV